MTDVYLAYAREDREGVRIIAEMLQFEGWDVWMDPSDPSGETSAAIDMKLGSAGAILVMWSGYSRHSEYVRSEAATGLYKNKLIQVSLDGADAPSPFDTLETIRVGDWTGERDHPQWRRVMEAVRFYAGAPGSARPLVQRRASSGPAYLEPRRRMAWGPVVLASLLVLGGAGLWMSDPFGWRATRVAVAESTEAAGVVASVATTAAPGGFVDTDASRQAWSGVDRQNPDALRVYAAQFPTSSATETARSLLRVLDAQAWVDAVIADNESGYQAYLKKFPGEAIPAGAMAEAANERLGSLRIEREQAITEIQTGLAALGLYKGAIDGRTGERTSSAVRQFASQNKQSAPQLASAAPRDLRALAESIQRVAGDRADTLATAAAPAPAPAAAAVTAAAEADRQRLAQAQAASIAATQAATQAVVIPETPVDADALAKNQLQRLTDADDWAAARGANTVTAYQSYLSAHPAGAQVTAARAAIADLNKPAPFAIDQAPSGMRSVIEAARRAQTTASARASAAREAASQADDAPGRTSIVAAGGDQYDAQVSAGAPNGLGTRISGNATNSGDRYRGQLNNGKRNGVGVYEFANNPGNAGAEALRYEGEHSGDLASGHGVTLWRNGDRFAGETRADGTSRGVLTFSNGQRYEGELRDGNRNGMGVIWSADGRVVMAGRWVDGDLVEPATDSADSGR